MGQRLEPQTSRYYVLAAAFAIVGVITREASGSVLGRYVGLGLIVLACACVYLGINGPKGRGT